MKKLSFFLVCFFWGHLNMIVYSQSSSMGFFIGGSGSLLMMNAEAEVENESVDVTDDLFTMMIDEDPYGIDITIAYDGWSWNNKMLYGLKPIVGYRFSSRFAVFGTYSYLFKKESEKSQTFNSQYMTGFRIRMDASMEFSQRSIQLLGQFYPVAGSGLFLLGGMEFVSLSAEQNFIYEVDNDPYYGDYSYPWKAKGSDKTNGFLFGGGFDCLFHPENMALTGLFMYSTSIFMTTMNY